VGAQMMKPNPNYDPAKDTWSPKKIRLRAAV
jgi:hypothetical protein